MFDIGFSEILLTCIVGLVVLGPQRLPVAIRTMMTWVRTIRGLAASVQNELKQELKLQELQENIKKAESLNLKELSPDLSKTVEELKESANKLRSELESRAAETNTTLEDQIDLVKGAIDNPAEYIHVARPSNESSDENLAPSTENISSSNPSAVREENSENQTTLSLAEQAEQEEIMLDEKLAHYINQYDPDNPLPANGDSSEKSSNQS